MIYQRRADTIEATRVESAEHAATVIGGTLAPSASGWLSDATALRAANVSLTATVAALRTALQGQGNIA